MSSVADNAAKQRFELMVDNQIVFADYKRKDNELSILHVEVPVALRGKGAAGQLMAGIAAIGKQDDLKLIPVCGYAVAWMRRQGDIF